MPQQKQRRSTSSARQQNQATTGWLSRYCHAQCLRIARRCTASTSLSPSLQIFKTQKTSPGHHVIWFASVGLFDLHSAASPRHSGSISLSLVSPEGKELLQRPGSPALLLLLLLLLLLSCDSKFNHTVTRPCRTRGPVKAASHSRSNGVLINIASSTEPRNHYCAVCHGE